jgi:3-oxo-5alpha-steroid 4-dehydrogenase
MHRPRLRAGPWSDILNLSNDRATNAAANWEDELAELEASDDLMAPYSSVRKPEQVDNADSIAWDDEADFVIVGYGGAGAAAAVRAAEQGVSVIALDRYDGGGSTAMNGGIFYAGGGTSVQKEAGVEDTSEEMFKYLSMETQGVVKDETLRRFCEESPATIEWLKQCGVQFNSTLYSKKTSYPYVNYDLYHPDNSQLPAYAAKAKPAARGHKGYMNLGKAAQGFGVTLYNPLRDTAERLGVKLMRQTDARQLIVDAAGRVVGVKVVQIPPGGAEAAAFEKAQKQALRFQMMVPSAAPGAQITIAIGKIFARKAARIERSAAVMRRIRARRGVCLTTGGFVQNRPMLEQYAFKYRDGMPNGSPGDDGSGILLGKSAGGKLDRMGQVSAWRFLNPPLAWGQGMLVNKLGARYVNEMSYGATIGHAMVEAQEGVGHLIIDSRLFKESWRQVLIEKVLPFQRDPALLTMLLHKRKASTIDRLVEKCGFDAKVFAKTVEDYNASARGEQPDPFDKAPEDIRGILEPPFYALDLSIDSPLFPLAIITMGGLTVNEETGQVRDANGAEIEGLYAAGRAAVGICSNIYVSGLSAADCIFSGRRAADHVASMKARNW